VQALINLSGDGAVTEKGGQTAVTAVKRNPPSPDDFRRRFINRNRSNRLIKKRIIELSSASPPAKTNFLSNPLAGQ
jgi:hypothetical protein